MRIALALSMTLCLAALADEDEKKKPPRDDEVTGALTEEAFKALHELTNEKRPAPKGKMVQLKESKAYLSLPKGKPPLPAVLVIHEWWGLNTHIKFWADRLAADGYAALAVDLYEGKVAKNRDDALKYVRAVDNAKALRVLQEAHGFLETDARVKASKRACIGWCFGGGKSLQLAIHAPDLDAAVIYYGRPERNPERYKTIRASILGVFGNQDRGIPPRTVDAFEKALKEAQVDVSIRRYDAPHAFANPSSARYAKDAAADAWKHTRKFLAERLKSKK